VSTHGATGVTCRECGCTDEEPCEGGCSWVEEGLCSRCDGRYPDDASCCIYCGSLDCTRMGGLVLCTMPRMREFD